MFFGSRISKVMLALVVVLVVIFLGMALGGYFGLGGAVDSGAQVQVAKGAELTFVDSDPPTLDPSLCGDVSSATYVVEIFSGLVALDRELQIVPDIAGRWEISNNGKTYTFYLRKDAKFHDGKAVTANDFKYAIERACDPRTESTVASIYLGDIVGAEDKLRGISKEVKGVLAKDDYTLEITIDAPKAYFLAKLTHPVAFALDRANVESGRSWTDRPNGTGPFKLNQYKRGEKLVLERNEQYYRGVAKLARVNVFLGGGSSMTMYENGEIDLTGVGLTDIERVLDPNNPLNKDLHITSYLDIFYLGFNTSMPPFDDVKVRQALCYAVDKKKIASVVLKDLVEPAYGILPPGMPGYNKELKGLTFDVAKAKELIAQSKYKDVSKIPPITITISGTGASLPPTSEALIAMWQQNLGLEVNIQQVESATFLLDLKKKKFQAFEVGWQADYPDPQDFLDILFYSKSAENSSAYSNPEVDALLEKARVEQDVAARLRMYQQIEQMIVNDAPWLPLWYGRSYILVKPYVKGYEPPPMVIPMLKDVYIEGK